MMETTRYTSCPGCSSAAIQAVMRATDATVSQQQFEIWECNACSLRFTQDIPTQAYIGTYYQSETYISHTDTRRGLINQLYHFARTITLKRKAKLLTNGNVGQTRNLLDIGAGTGAFCSYMKQQGWTVTGIEPDASTRQRASSLHHIQLLEPTAFFDLPTGSFDAITLWHVLEHVHDLHGYLKQIHHMLKPGGHLYIAVPNYTSKDAQHYQAFWAAYDVPRHLYHFSPRSMQSLLQQHQLQLTKTIPMWFDSFYISMLSEKIKGRRSSFLSGLWQGLLSNLTTLVDRNRCSSLIYVIRKS